MRREGRWKLEHLEGRHHGPSRRVPKRKALHNMVEIKHKRPTNLLILPKCSAPLSSHDDSLARETRALHISPARIQTICRPPRATKTGRYATHLMTNSRTRLDRRASSLHASKTLLCREDSLARSIWRALRQALARRAHARKAAFRPSIKRVSTLSCIVGRDVRGPGGACLENGSGIYAQRRTVYCCLDRSGYHGESTCFGHGGIFCCLIVDCSFRCLVFGFVEILPTDLGKYHGFPGPHGVAPPPPPPPHPSEQQPLYPGASRKKASRARTGCSYGWTPRLHIFLRFVRRD